ncbi:putative gamma-glutamyltranspeptidase [Actinoplanes missouriensis 431]|uniref:Glutathione hydrolase proenzyme n=1 Tax=Actinoplanes missouriensis (strain ATCC 14538 / DSM 43046 / CBS 188.64 / JCM 3121 / NBRC 102363 / NCIMB 12654 / NRRL B-3342 / UNCC 431) TaxID=512565 RepID=I0HF40_ACTM4|nr:gamma-glutamyltransferase [Actinoplanes missouriensis]BAL91627.1 putative gamma-glutamyltranspeptidase [Actinoplanes missouriensis 431]
MRFLPALTALSLTTLGVVAAAPPASAAGAPGLGPTATGYGGAVATVDATATAVGLDVLRKGGNAVDAAIAAAATLGVTEPFSAGIGGGGFFVYYDAKRRSVSTIDGRETGPATMTEDYFIDPADGLPYDFSEARVSGLSVGVPGTVATWEAAARKWGTRSLAEGLRPAARVAERGFGVDATFRQQVADNAAAFGQFDSTREIYLPGGAPPAVGSTLRNPDLADTYRLIAKQGSGVFYRGAIADDLIETVRNPPVADDPTGAWAYPIRPGELTKADLARYRLRFPSPTRSDYRGLTVYGMNTPSSGGIAVSEALNIIEKGLPGSASATEKLHYYLEASALAFADRNRYVGADTSPQTVKQLLSDRWAAQRACRIDPGKALTKPVPPGDITASGCTPTTVGKPVEQGQSTTNLTVADRWGNVVEYTFTIEQTGGNAMVVPDRGFLLNNELTDFNFAPTQGTAADPNLPGPGKRPRSSMSPTIVLKDGKPFLALGSPGGATIITTVLQVLVNRLDLGMTLPEAMAAPRASQRNSAGIQAEPAFRARYGPQLTALGHTFGPDVAELGAATAIEFTRGGGLIASAEPVRRGGGAAAVVRPRR